MNQDAKIVERAGHGGDTDDLAIGPVPRTISNALATAAQELSWRERWVSRRSVAAAFMPRLLSVLYAMGAARSARPGHRQVVREGALRLIAYMPADMRIAALIRLVDRDPDIVDDLLSGDIDPKFEIYRYNVLSSLGVFARHGLVEEVFTADRLRAVGEIMRKRDNRKGSE